MSNTEGTPPVTSQTSLPVRFQDTDLHISPFSSVADDFPTIDIPIPSAMRQPVDGGPLNFRPTTEAYSSHAKKKPAHKYENITLDEDVDYDERLHCFNGLVPLDVVTIIINSYSIIASIVCISISSFRINNGIGLMIGARSLYHFLVSCTFFLPLCNIFLGFLLFSTSCFGLFNLVFNNKKIYNFKSMFMTTIQNNYTLLRKLDVIYHSCIYLCSTICVSQFIFSTIVSSMLMRNQYVINNDTYTFMMHSHPYYFCQYEEKLGCTMMTNCNSNNNISAYDVHRYSKCPGVFCVEFCRVNPRLSFDSSSVHPLCRPCRRQKGRLRQFFGNCRSFELEIGNSTNTGQDDVEFVQAFQNDTDVISKECFQRASNDLYTAGLLSILTSTIYLSCVIAINAVSCYKLCYL